MTLLVLDASAAVETALWTPDGARLAAHVATAETVVVPDHSSSEGEDSTSAAEMMAEEAGLRQARVAETDRYAAALGVAPVRTLGELVDLMVAARVLLVDEGGRYAINPAAPLPAEVLPLSAEEATTQDQMRWHDLHHATAQALIRLFDPDAQSRDRLRTSLQKLARQVDAEVESVRAAVVTLLDEGDFTASLDVAIIREHQVFELAVDWDRFASTRISIRTASTGPAQNAGSEDPGAP